jgi:RNA polymerase subunit RPABC4/transcription elongation factor Spt4
VGKVCQSCGNKLKDDAKFCGKCGSKYIETTQEKINERKCQRCGTEVKSGMKFCPKCGDQIEKTNVGRIKGNKNGKKKWIFLLCGIVILFVFIGAFSGDDDNKNVTLNTASPTGAVYNYDLEEAKDKVNTILSDYFGEVVNLDTDFKVYSDEDNDGVIAYVYDMSSWCGYGMAIEFMTLDEGKEGADEELVGVGVKGKREGNKDPSERASFVPLQEIFVDIVSEFTDAGLTMSDMEDMVALRASDIYYSDNNLYDIFGVYPEIDDDAYVCSVKASTESYAKSMEAKEANW